MTVDAVVEKILLILRGQICSAVQFADHRVIPCSLLHGRESSCFYSLNIINARPIMVLPPTIVGRQRAGRKHHGRDAAFHKLTGHSSCQHFSASGKTFKPWSNENYFLIEHRAAKRIPGERELNLPANDPVVGRTVKVFVKAFD